MSSSTTIYFTTKWHIDPLVLYCILIDATSTFEYTLRDEFGVLLLYAFDLCDNAL